MCYINLITKKLKQNKAPNDIVSSWVENENNLNKFEELSEKIAGPTMLCGELTAAERQTLSRKWKNALLTSPAQATRHPSMLAEIGWQRWQAGQRDDPVLLSPIYLHIAGGGLPE